MPSPVQQNAEIISLKDLVHEVTHDGVSIMGGRFADGAVLEEGTAFAVASADCPTGVMFGKNGGPAIAFHAGRQSLVQNEELLDQHFVRHHRSVIDAALEAMKSANVPLDQIFLGIYCGIRIGFTHYRNHPQYGEINARLVEYCNLLPQEYADVVLDEESGMVDMPALVAAQAIHRGINPGHIIIDSIDTFGQEDTWASNRRGDQRRNLVLVQTG